LLAVLVEMMQPFEVYPTLCQITFTSSLGLGKAITTSKQIDQ
jgi:hypothetical protein